MGEFGLLGETTAFKEEENPSLSSRLYLEVASKSS